MDSVRQSTEVLGFTTTSVLDTISEIGGVFSNLRSILGGIGFVALIVASLGIFNTLSISLLERTRELGILKVIGMKSSEIHDYLLIEALLISLAGGILGLILGALLGKIFSLIINYFFVPSGTSLIDISVLPINFIFFIITLSLLTGGVTGVYPAFRATKISALDALRYE
jgi:putative ABC transport system permease protein